MITLALFWGLWAIFIGVVMVVDRNMRVEEDFAPTPGGYFVLAAISPFMVLPIDFYSSRRSSTTGRRALAALAGVALTVPCWCLASWHMSYVAITLRLLAGA